MTERIKIIRKKTEVIGGRRQQETSVFYECWCEVQSLATSEKYTALQTGIENTIVFKVRNCRMDLCQYFRQKKLKGYAAVLSSSSSFCCGVI